MPPARATSSMWYELDGETLQMFGVFWLSSSIRFIVNGTSASPAMARMWSTVFVLPPIAMSRIIALSNAEAVAISRGSRPCPGPTLPNSRAIATIRCAARS